MTKRTAWLHVGLPRTGVRGLTRNLARHADVLADLGFSAPLASTVATDRAAADILLDHRERGWTRRDVEGTWARACHRAWKGRRVPVLGSERFATAPPDRVDLLLDCLGGLRPRAVLALRDPGTLLVEAWADEARAGRCGSLAHWADRVARPRPDDGSALATRAALDLPRVLETWTRALGPERVQVVVLPPDRDPADALWRATLMLLGLGHELTRAGDSPVLPALPGRLRGEAAARAAAWTESLAAHGVPVLGDPAHLRPLDPAPGRPAPEDLLPPEPAAWLARA